DARKSFQDSAGDGTVLNEQAIGFATPLEVLGLRPRNHRLEPHARLCEDLLLFREIDMVGTADDDERSGRSGRGRPGERPRRRVAVKVTGSGASRASSAARSTLSARAPS